MPNHYNLIALKSETVPSHSNSKKFAYMNTFLEKSLRHQRKQKNSGYKYYKRDELLKRRLFEC